MKGSRVRPLTIRAKTEDARSLRREILTVIFNEVEADGAAVWHARQIGDEDYIGVGDVSDGDAAAVSIDAFPPRLVPDRISARIRNPDPRDRERFRSCESETNNSFQNLQFLDPSNSEQFSNSERSFRDGMGVLVFSKSCFTGWIGLWRREPRGCFSAAERERLDGKIPQLRTLLSDALSLETESYKEQAGTLLLRLDGVITHMSPTVERWFTDDHRDQLVNYVKNRGLAHFGGKSHFLFGMHATVAPLTGLNAEPVYMIKLASAKLPCICLESVLTPAQQEVAELAAEGKSSDEIADILTRSPHTIKTHLRDIYQRLDISSRFDLVTHFD